jgi:hypothetical protein
MLKKMYRVKLATSPQPLTLLADGYRVDQRSQTLHVYDKLPGGNKEYADPVFSATVDTWQYVRLVGEREVE